MYSIQSREHGVGLAVITRTMESKLQGDSNAQEETIMTDAVEEPEEKPLWERGEIKLQFFRDINYFAIALPSEYHVDYAVYEAVEGIDASGKKDILFQREGMMSSPHYVNDIKLAEVFLHGFVKWDGCSNWMFNENERDTMLHGCSRTDLTNLGEVMARCWDWTKELLPTWNI